MDDKYDLRGLLFSTFEDLIPKVLEGTPLEDSSAQIAFGLATFAVVNIVFLMLFFSQFAILWIERKAVARMNDRRGATTALRSLWVGENGVTAGEWWNMLPFGLGKPIGGLNKFLNKKFGNQDEKFATVDRVNNRSWMGYSIFPGFFQNVADGMKFLVKEHMVPQRADKLIFEVSPFLIVSSTLLILGIIPLSSGMYATNPELSILYAIAIFGIAPIGVFFAGWSSNNKYTLIGGIRSAAQLTAYEIPLLLTLLSVAVLSGTFNIIESVHFQHSAGSWNLFLMPLGAGLFLLTMIAEVERVPFDMPEAEAELVEGWWTEYGGMRFGMLFMAEYIRTYAACFLFTHFFLGGWHLPFQGLISQIPLLGDAYLLIPGAIVVLLKAWLVFLVVFVWARFSLARIRTDQILEFGWRILLPLAVLQVVLAGVYRLYLFDPNEMKDTAAGGWAWDAFGIPMLVPILTTVVWLGIFVLFLNDEDKSGNTERMFHVYTEKPAGTYVPGQE
ncbi:MAG TPA: NADH-quinone oxidoreductase subunit H [Candidatus Poseidoniales archaeon]|nr:MAG TPA: NADH-quinone oxidoreductase subunit H [Candidatus Poseidoniales archaeon]HII58940.1 NADH-quinone oxidoreductase subunit H [Candidatus Poseidoniaceae archaeon]|tara:strand:- start:8257 stop:9759 length:1503 start_codon:yes stop_codon:yes gene_type:complete